MLSDFSAVAAAIASTNRRSEKERFLADYLRTLDDASLERAVVFFSGGPFARREQKVTGVGHATIADAAVEATGRTREELWAAWPRYADLGDTVAELFSSDAAKTITLVELGEYFDRIAATSGAIEKTNVLVALFRAIDAQQVRYVIKILQSEFRIGLQESLVESAIAKAFGQLLPAVRRANMFTGDIGAAALLARSDSLATARMTLFHPFAFMLAQPEEDPKEIVQVLGADAVADDKYDGIRAQIHCDGQNVRIYSRTLDEITHRFPEIATAVRTLGQAIILDGEIVAFRDRILPFAVIQTRLGRSKPSKALLRDAPVAFFAFDLLYRDGDPLFEMPLSARRDGLRDLLGGQIDIPLLRLTSESAVRDSAHIDELFDAARARANEGLVIKDPASVYTPGRRGKSWLKYKKALGTLDCVVTYAEYGHGKRRAVLSDLTFAVIRDGELVNIGKAYSGLTDVEIAHLTELFKRTTVEHHGPLYRVSPTTVLEIAFDRIQMSKRHKSGYALRFPRIVRIREDKTPQQASTIDDVRRIYEGQLKREAQE